MSDVAGPTAFGEFMNLDALRSQGALPLVFLAAPGFLVFAKRPSCACQLVSHTPIHRVLTYDLRTRVQNYRTNQRSWFQNICPQTQSGRKRKQLLSRERKGMPRRKEQQHRRTPQRKLPKRPLSSPSEVLAHQ